MGHQHVTVKEDDQVYCTVCDGTKIDLVGDLPDPEHENAYPLTLDKLR
jgi:hypothetical protein